MGPSRELDGCLTILEDALQRGESRVLPHVAASVNVQALGVDVVEHMPTKLALDLVFREQERRLNGPVTRPPRALLRHNRSMGGSASANREPLTEDEAHALTERIKSGARLVCLLVLEAHDRRAWKVLRYRSWSEYMRSEFGYSRSRSYELLDQGRVVRAVKAAAGVASVPHISGLMASRLKPHLGDLVNRISSVVAEPDGKDRDDAIRDAINAISASAKAARPGKLPESTSPLGRSDHDLVTNLPRSGANYLAIDRATLIPAVRYLASLSAPTGATVSPSFGSADDLALLDRAVAWLKSLRAYLTTRDRLDQELRKTNFRQESRHRAPLSGDPDRFLAESMAASS